MWDCPGADPDGNGGDCSVFFDPAQHTLLLGEAGATSLYVLDCYALAELAIAINRPDVATELLRRASIIALNLDAFWDEEYSTYSNLLTNGSFYRRISPTTFYPMMVLPTNDVAFFRAQRLMDSWLTNKTRFCIDISGNWPDGSDNPEGCWWGLPSISFDDPSFYRPASYIYWRGTLRIKLLMSFLGSYLYSHVGRFCLDAHCPVHVLGAAEVRQGSRSTESSSSIRQPNDEPVPRDVAQSSSRLRKLRFLQGTISSFAMLSCTPLRLANTCRTLPTAREASSTTGAHLRRSCPSSSRVVTKFARRT